MNTNQNQVRDGTGLLQPGVTRRAAKIVHRDDSHHLVPGTHVTVEELHRYQLLGRRLQARATAAALGSLFRALLWPAKKLAAAYARASREAAAIRELSALDDHLLADIGLSRGQIPAAVAGLLARPASARRQPVATVVHESRLERPAGCNDAHTKAAA